MVISQHLSAAPPAIADHRPDLPGVDSVLAKALAKDPSDRFERCADFARALTHRLTAAAPDDRAPPVCRRARPGAPSADKPRSRLRPAVVVPAVLAVLLLVAIAVAALEFVRADSRRRADGRTPTTSTARVRRALRRPRRCTTTTTPPGDRDRDGHRDDGTRSTVCRGHRRQLRAAGQHGDHRERSHRVLLLGAGLRSHDLVV